MKFIERACEGHFFVLNLMVMYYLGGQVGIILNVNFVLVLFKCVVYYF